ncbi:MAG: hypothetical protein WC824_15290 [Bacteroidota bacterium]|jgi:hypothetical protein
MSDLRQAVIKLAREIPELRKHLVPLLRKTAMEFDTEEALKKYLGEHPKADKSIHHVKKQEEKKPSAEKSKNAPLSKAEHTHKLPGGTKVRVYDNGGETTADRYTVVFDGPDWDSGANPGYKTTLGLDDEGGKYVSQFGEGKEGKHLGKPVKFDDLNDVTKKHIIQRAESD